MNYIRKFIFLGILLLSTTLLYGVSLEYNENGDLIYFSTENKGRKDGVLYEAYEDGSIKNFTEYTTNKKDGVYQTYYESGALKTAGTYDHGYRVGPNFTYYESGSLKEVSIYVYDRKYYHSINYYENGSVKSVIDYSGTQYYPLDKKTPYTGPLRNGDVIYYYRSELGREDKDPKIMLRAYYHAGEPDYDPNRDYEEWIFYEKDGTYRYISLEEGVEIIKRVDSGEIL